MAKKFDDILLHYLISEALKDVGRQFPFTDALVVCRDGGDMYHEISDARYVSLSDNKRELLSPKVKFPVSAHMPLFLAIVQTPDPYSCNFFAKQPLLIFYDRYHQGPQPNCIADNVLREAEICELLRQHPHPNIAKYIGCQVADGKIMSICFANYDQLSPNTIARECFEQTDRAISCSKAMYQSLLTLDLVKRRERV